MNAFIRQVGLFCLILSAPLTSFAWNAYGHLLIAEVAYQNLKPAVKDKVDGLVSTLHDQYSSVSSFNQLADWPDTLRGESIDAYTRWHYINIAFSFDGSPLKDLVNDDNAVWAIQKSEPVIKNAKANPSERARFLAFMSHIVGDLHQPLHTVSYISANLPDGDRGGNQYFVIYRGKRQNLHFIWDNGLGAFDGSTSSDKIRTAAKSLMQQFPEAYFNQRPEDLNPEHWAQEGLELAKQSVYNTPPDLAVSTEYLDNGKRLAQENAALAGYRLANLLNQLLS